MSIYIDSNVSQEFVVACPCENRPFRRTDVLQQLLVKRLCLLELTQHIADFPVLHGIRIVHLLIKRVDIGRGELRRRSHCTCILVDHQSVLVIDDLHALYLHIAYTFCKRAITFLFKDLRLLLFSLEPRVALQALLRHVL